MKNKHEQQHHEAANRIIKNRFNSHKTIKKVSIALVGLLLITQIGIFSAVIEDQKILSEPISNVYVGRSIGNTITNNLQFSDVVTSFWGREAITRMGALDVTKGYYENGVRAFKPSQRMSKQEALAFIIRALGREEDALKIAEALVPGQADTTLSLWSKGYLTIANQIGLITNPQLTDALADDQTVLDPAINFIRDSEVTREQIAMWIVQGINSKVPNAIVPDYTTQNIYTFRDWQEIGVAYIPFVEAVVDKKIMVGDGRDFNPKASFTRAEMMQMMKNMDTILYDSLGLTTKTGYVGHIETQATTDAKGTTTTKRMWVRNSDGTVDQLVKETVTTTGGKTTKDAVVYRGSQVTGLDVLDEGDSISYIVNDVTKEVYYVNVQPNEATYTISGILEPLSDLANGTITVVTDQGYKQNFTMSQSIYDPIKKEIIINELVIGAADAPVTNRVALSVRNQLVTKIAFNGTLAVTNEINGLVVEHNTAFNYMRISDWNGNETTKRYNETTVDVEKEAYYDNEDQVGYFDQLFPYYGFDEDDAKIDEIEVGDIVHVKLDSNNKENILAISAKTNYTVKFGDVVTSVNKGNDGILLTLKMSDQSIATYKVPTGIAVIKGTQNLSLIDVKAGDVVRILVNQGVTAPGTIVEGIKEIMIDPLGNVVEKVYKGDLGSVNSAQQTMSVLNNYELNQTGWANYNATKTFDLSKVGVEYYYNDKRISLDYANKYLRSDAVDMYLVTEKYFSKERVTKVAFREGRDSVLPQSNITVTNGLNQFETQSYENPIKIDTGTIVIKNGKLISPSNVIAPDYTQVVLNGNNQAAVITVTPEPNNDAISIFRGRIAKINDFKDFSVVSNSSLSNMEWIYSPIERSFEIDYKTVIKEGEDILDLSTFIDYSDSSKVDEVYTIIAEGVKATHISKMPFSKDGVIGDIFSIDLEKGKISLKDTLVYDKTTKQWNELSRPNSYSLMEILNESVIIKNNKVISVEELAIGDHLRVMTTVDLASLLKLEDKREFVGHIIFVEK